jgi:membrane-associated phospholipid phosphatase
VSRPRRAALAAVVALATASAGGPPAAAEDDVRFDPAVDVPVGVAAGLAWLIGAAWVTPRLAPDACRWCDRDGAIDRTPALDRAARDALRWDDRALAGTLSDLGAYGLTPALGLGLPAALAIAGDRRGDLFGNGAIVLEAAFLAADLNVLVKLAAGRERPFVHHLPADERPDTEVPHENNLSFYSGHTSFAFSVAVASGTVASLRGYRHAWLVWAAGLAVASSVGYLRIAADKHYATDVLTGAAVGAAVGVAVPTWLAGRRAHIAASATREGAIAGLRVRF